MWESTTSERFEGPWGAVLKIYTEMEGEAGVVRRLYEAVLAARDLRRIERRVGFIRPRRL